MLFQFFHGGQNVVLKDFQVSFRTLFRKTEFLKEFLRIGDVNKDTRGKKILQRITVTIFLDFLMFYQIFLLPQVEGSDIISNHHGIYELPHEFSNKLRLTILKN